jgi:hypothetical protein
MDTTGNLEAVDEDRRLVGTTTSDAGHQFHVSLLGAELAELRRRMSAPIEIR